MAGRWQLGGHGRAVRQDAPLQPVDQMLRVDAQYLYVAFHEVLAMAALGRIFDENFDPLRRVTPPLATAATLSAPAALSLSLSLLLSRQASPDLSVLRGWLDVGFARRLLAEPQLHLQLLLVLIEPYNGRPQIDVLVDQEHDLIRLFVQLAGLLIQLAGLFGDHPLESLDLLCTGIGTGAQFRTDHPPTPPRPPSSPPAPRGALPEASLRSAGSTTRPCASHIDDA